MWGPAQPCRELFNLILPLLHFNVRLLKLRVEVMVEVPKPRFLN